VETPIEFRVAPLEICGGDSTSAVPCHWRFVVERVFQPYHAAVILPLLPIHLNLNMTLIRRTSGRRLAPSIKATPSFISGVHCYSASVGIFTAAWLRNSPLCCAATVLSKWLPTFRNFANCSSIIAASHATGTNLWSSLKLTYRRFKISGLLGRNIVLFGTIYHGYKEVCCPAFIVDIWPSPTWRRKQEVARMLSAADRNKPYGTPDSCTTSSHW
jgi:hypothetical protein